ncbi:hypothetical protein CHH60_02990 [Paenibacillus sp. 7523-1]|nr:hypothetical protein CHH60_02990 [Paenibacillus sp. 7523-1]
MITSFFINVRFSNGSDLILKWIAEEEDQYIPRPLQEYKQNLNPILISVYGFKSGNKLVK